MRGTAQQVAWVGRGHAESLGSVSAARAAEENQWKRTKPVSTLHAPLGEAGL